MNYFKSIGYRLTVVVVAVVLIAVSATLGLFVLQDFQGTVEKEKLRLKSTAAVFAAATSQVVADQDRRAVLEVLRGVRELPNMTYVAAINNDGSVLAELGSAVFLMDRSAKTSHKSNFDFFTADTVETDTPIVNSGVKVGTLFIQSSIEWLRLRYMEQLANTFIIGLLAILSASVAANVLIGRLMKPLREMSHELTAMGDQQDLSKRFDQKRKDELGVLAEALNRAFSGIDERDRALRKHRDTLEQTVVVRTRELRDAVEKEQRANAAKSEFLSTMSHEIRTPMNGMMVMAELLASAPLSPKHHRYAQVIYRSGGTLLSIINDVLDMSKIESGQFELERTSFLLDDLVEDIVSIFSARAHEKGLCLSLHVDRAAAQTVIGDPTRLGQVLSNLANNALKFTESGGVAVNVRVVSTNRTEKSQRLRFEVRDTGIGIPEDKLEHIFERFTQADQTTTRKFGGTGLGLPISRRIVEAMNGKLQVESTQGEGTCFHFEIDMQVDAFATHQSETAHHASMSVLLIEPNSVLNSAIRDSLRDWGFDVAASRLDGDFPATDIILARNCALTQAKAANDSKNSRTPIILLQQFGEEHYDNSDTSISGVIPLPLGRKGVNALTKACRTGDFTALAIGNSPIVQKSNMPAFPNISVLAVDDDPINREVLHECLTALKVNATYSESGEQALEEIIGYEFDLILMDCSMPGMDGYETTKKIRQIEKEEHRNRSRIVALSAHVSGEAFDKWRMADMDGFLSKPFKISQIADELAALSNASSDDTVTLSRDVADSETLWPHDPPLLSEEMLKLFESAARTGGNNLQARVFALFCNHVPPNLAKIRAAVDGGENAQLTAKLLHALKSMCTSAGAARAAYYCDLLEIAANNGETPSAEKIEELEEILEQTRAEMAAFSGLEIDFPQSHIDAEVLEA